MKKTWLQPKTAAVLQYTQCSVTKNYANIHSSFGGAEEACWPLIPKFAGSNAAEAVGFLKGDKNPQHACLRNGSKIIGPMLQICGM
jgi:hypothetical protein